MKMMFIIAILMICEANAYFEDVRLTIPPQKSPKFIVGNTFLSAALDTSVVASHFKNFDMSNEKLVNLVKKLNLGYLRIGGNMADRLYFENKVPFPGTRNNILSTNYSCIYDEIDDCEYDFPNFTMSGEEWTSLNNFAKNVGTQILFDLNCLIRNEDGSWDSRNAEELISFSAERKFEIDWQLGNEPNAFKHVFNYAVNATQLAKDFSKLRNILNKFDWYKQSLVVGPDVTRPQPDHRGSIKYLREFLRGIEDKNILNAVAFHQYYLNGRIATVNDFLNPDTFDLLDNQIKIVKRIVENSKEKQSPIWLTETSTAYGGGATGLSNTFVGSFLWLDKLGLAAKHGIKTVIRQSIFHDSYALIDGNYNPSPDWWLTMFYNKLVGIQVLECNLAGPATLRLYCHCAFEKGSYVTVFGINLSNVTVKINVENKSNHSSYAYVLTSDDSILSTNVLANNKILTLEENGNFPDVPPVIIKENDHFTIPAYSLVFWTIPFDIEACVTPFINFL